MQNALAYILFMEGVPFIYYGTEQAYTVSRKPLCVAHSAALIARFHDSQQPIAHDALCCMQDNTLPVGITANACSTIVLPLALPLAAPHMAICRRLHAIAT
jgi:glycosidase